MPFKHKLSVRLAISRALLVVLTITALSCVGSNVAGPEAASELVDLVISPSSATVFVNDSVDFQAYGISATGDSIEVSVTWTSTGDNPVKRKGKAVGHFKAKKPGKFDLTARVDSVDIADTAEVTVEPEAVCGDGGIEGTEECDDGDTSTGDGCSSSCRVESGYTCSGEPSACVSNPNILWSTSHESGNVVSEWEGGGMSGGMYNSGSSEIIASTEAAHSGIFSARMHVWNLDTSSPGARIHKHPRTNDGYFSTWYMFPEIPQVNGWSNIMQWKLTCGGQSTPTWFMHIYSTAADRQSGELGFKAWRQGSTPPNAMPERPTVHAGEWFHMEAYYRVGVNDGIIRVWVNGELYWDLQDINTQKDYGDGDSCDNIIRSWGPTLYGNDWIPTNVISYVDDVVVSTGRIGR